MTTLSHYTQQRQRRIEAALQQMLPGTDIPPQRLHEAMHYAVFSGGKRLRPLLVYAAGEATGARLSYLDQPAVAVELIHTYSLVHDDLPAMDDDDFRRGKPSCHRRFDEATAILVGDALQALAFECLAHTEKPHPNALKMCRVLAECSGSHGLVGGQADDLAVQAGEPMNRNTLEMIHRNKTARLFQACVCLGYLATEETIDPATYDALYQFGECFGIGFQIRDDILDYDPSNSAPCYVQQVGLTEAYDRLDTLYEEAMDALAVFDARALPLRQLTESLLQVKVAS